jgi:hypothetical protein
MEEVRRLGEELGKGDAEPTRMTADSTYFSAENTQQEGKGIELLIASEREGKEEPVQRSYLLTLWVKVPPL